jgi:hypothetical protein
MGKWLLVVGTNCIDESREAEFNDWYNNTHLADVLETPGFTRVARYENTDPAEGEAKYLATYEIETDDIDGFLKKHNANMDKKRAEGRFTNLSTRVSRGFYKQISSVTR